MQFAPLEKIKNTNLLQIALQKKYLKLLEREL